MPNKEFYIRLTLGVYKVSQLFPEKESLKTDIRNLADEILVSLLAGQYENGSRMIEEMNRLLDLAESRGWADSRNFSVLRQEYAKISEKPVDNSFQNKKNKKRQKAILGILKSNGRIKMSDLAKSFPGLNRRTLLRDMGVFCQTGVIKRNGTGRGACYSVRNATLYKEMSQLTYKMSNLRKTYSQVYDKYVKKIYRFVLLKVNSAEIAEDLTSEVFMRGWQAFKEQRSDKIENVQAFLYQIARNLLADHYRQEAKAQLVSVEYAPPLPDQNQDLEEMSFIQSDLDRVKAALVNINDDYREVIVWYYLDELRVPEIAKILNKSEPTVRVLIHRAIQSLKQELK